MGALGDVVLLRRAVFALKQGGFHVTLVAPARSGGVLLGAGPADVDALLDWERPDCSALLGTASTSMIDNVVDSRFFRVVDYPTASALSVILMAAILVLVAWYVRRSGTEDLL